MSNWQDADNNTKCYELSHWFEKLNVDKNDLVNGVHIDDIQESLFDLFWLLVKLNILVYVDTGEGEPAIWMKKKS